MGVPRERQGKAVGQIGKDFGFVREQDRRLVGAQRRDRRVEVGDGALAGLIFGVGDLIAEAGEP